MIGLQYAWRSVLAGRLLLLFLLVTLVPAGALIVLGLRLASQDRVLLGQRIAELRPQSLDYGALGNRRVPQWRLPISPDNATLLGASRFPERRVGARGAVRHFPIAHFTTTIVGRSGCQLAPKG